MCVCECVCVSVRASRSALEQRLTSAAVDRQMFLGPSPAHPPGATHPPTPTPSAFHLPSPALQGPPPFFVDFFPIYGNRVRGQKKKNSTFRPNRWKWIAKKKNEAKTADDEKWTELKTRHLGLFHQRWNWRSIVALTSEPRPLRLRSFFFLSFPLSLSLLPVARLFQLGF